MSRFVGFSLTKRTDELLRPSEKKLKDAFFQDENVKFIYLTVKSNSTIRLSYDKCLDIMDNVFRLSIVDDNHPSVNEMNIVVFKRIREQSDQIIDQQRVQKERAFTNANIPTNILPRPSMALPRNDDDEARGKYTIEMLR